MSLYATTSIVEVDSVYLANTLGASCQHINLQTATEILNTHFGLHA